MRIWPWRSRARRDEELDEEIQGHLTMAARERIDRGERPDAAEQAAAREFGNRALIKEVTRDVWPGRAVETFWQDVRYGLRTLRRSPGFTAVAVLSLALGIGANTAIFSLINTLMLRDLPVRDPGRLVEPLWLYPGDPRMNYFSWTAYERYRDQNHVFSDVIGVSPVRFAVAAEGLEAEAVDAQYVTANFFPALGVHAAIGRLLEPEDDRTAATSGAVAVLSWSYWNRRFNREPSAVGRRLTIGGVPATVVGVAPREFFGLQVGVTPDVWIPAGMARIVPRSSGASGSPLPPLMLMARLKPGVSLEQAAAEMRVLDRSRVEEIAKTSRDPLWRQVRLELEPAGAGFSRLRDLFARPLRVLMAIVGVLLLIACTNIAGLLLARSASRQREMAMRVALGAGRRRLVRQVLTESLLLSVVASLIGIGLAYFGADALVRMWPMDFRLFHGQRLEVHAAPDLRVLLFTAGVALATGVLFGMAPAWNAFASAPLSSLRQGGGAGETKSRRLFGQSLIVAQVALSVVLLSAAGLFVGHLSNLRNVDLGFRRDSVLLVTLDQSRSGYERVQLSNLYRSLVERLAAIPGVRSVALSAVTPIEGPAASRFIGVEGFQEPSEQRRRVMLNWVGPKYFETLGTPLIAGRDFQAFEDDSRPRVAIVNRTMARYYFGDANPLGRRFRFEGQERPYEIVGLAGDAKYLDLHEPAPRTIYLNAFQDARGVAQQFALQTSVPPAAVAGDVRRIVRDTLKTVAVAKVTTLAEQVDASIVPERVIAVLAGFFGGLGALLVAIGLYGLLAYSVARRVNEIGVRMALGATRADVTVMVLKSACAVVCVGLIVGAPVALWSRRFASSVMEHLPLASPLPIAFAAVAMIAIALVAAYVPARRAATVDPMQALRQE